MATNGDSRTRCFVWMSDIVKEPQKMLMPICGYEDMPLVSLEEAVTSLVSILPRILDYVYVAKQRCEPVPADGLTRDESSAIILYTMEWEPTEKCLYFALNSTLRCDDRRQLKPWLSYLKLILTALYQLPSHRHFVYRALEMDISELYPKDKTWIWWAFSSCTSSIELLENQQFFEKTGARTLFTIDSSSGKDISRHSYNQSEEEILLLPARQFIVKSCFQPAPDLHMIYLKEMEPPISLLQPLVIDCSSNKLVSTLTKKPVSSRIFEKSPRQEEFVLKVNSNCAPQREINILLLGPTGVGKSTFINAFANYIVNNTLADAVNDKMQVIIPSSFQYTDPATFNERAISVDKEDEYEKLVDVNQPNTGLCRSFVFPVGDRNLRFIDTPGIDDTKGHEKDPKTFQEILKYIAHYEHLNAVCILLKPNEERLNVCFQFCINELIQHLHVNAKDNLIFVFTNARSTFFMPGATKKILQELLDKHRKEFNIDVPFSMTNTFLFDNEPFRYLALCKSGIQLDNEQTQSYTKSWDHSVKEYSRLMEHINSCTLRATNNTLSLNEAEQLVRKLPRPIAETIKLIEENIQLAKEHKTQVLHDPQIASRGIPQNIAVIIPLKHPRTVCAGKNCCRVIEINNLKKVEYSSICHNECYLAGVEQETLGDPKLKECETMIPYKGFCKVCNCHWRQHKHITYEYKSNRAYVNPNPTNQEIFLKDIDNRISDLEEEATKIQAVCRKLAEFLHTNAMLPINDKIVAYLAYFIREEKMKGSSGAHNAELITSLETIITGLASDIELCERVLQSQGDSTNVPKILEPEEVLTLVATLYQLPITGQQFHQQVEGIIINQERHGAQRETYLSLPTKAASSKIMLQFKGFLSS